MVGARFPYINYQQSTINLTPVRRVAFKLLSRVDAWYERKHRLRAIGPVLRVGYVRYQGPYREFPDGTVLRENELIGRLHFNNATIAAIGEGSLHRAGFRFAKLMRESLRTLAHAAQSDPELRSIRVFHGVTWIPAHGDVVGFVSTPREKTWRTRLLSGYFRLLRWAFAPAERTRARPDIEPRDYWLTQRTLAQNLHKLKVSP
jgi:hypothetical protein